MLLRRYLMLILCGFNTVLLMNCAVRVAPKSVLLNALAKQAETICFIDGTVLGDRSKSIKQLTLPMGLLRIGLAGMRPGDVFINNNLHYILVGAKEFSAPPGLGIMRAKTIYYLRYQAPMQINVRAFKEIQQAHGLFQYPTWKWDWYDPDTKETLHFVMVQASEYEVWISTDIEFMRSTFSSVTIPEYVLQDRPEWNEATLKCSIWAVRRYRHDNVKDSLAGGILISREHRVGEGAVALTFGYDEVQQTAKLLYFSPERDGFVQFWQSMPRATVEEIRSGLWSVDFKVDAGSNDYILYVYHLFGFGLFL